MKKYNERWNNFEWYEKILVIPGLAVVGIISIILLPFFLFIYIGTLTMEFFDSEDDSHNIFY